jgi:hypothetical protein
VKKQADDGTSSVMDVLSFFTKAKELYGTVKWDVSIILIDIYIEREQCFTGKNSSAHE